MEQDITSKLKKDIFVEEGKENKQDAPIESIDSNNESIQETLKRIGKSEEDLKDAIMELVDAETYTENILILNKLNIVLETPKPIATDAFYDLIMEYSDSSENRFKFIYGLYSIASTIKFYKDINLREHCLKELEKKEVDTEFLSKQELEKIILKCKVEFLETKLPLPVLTILEKEVLKFNTFTNLLTKEEISDFL